MSSEDCKNLIDLAKEFKLLIVCDDVYNLLWYEGDSCPKRLLQWDKEVSNIISNGTFSKVLAPGVRVGQYFLTMLLEFTYLNMVTLYKGSEVSTKSIRRSSIDITKLWY